MRESPLFWPIKLTNNVIFCLDETALPKRLVYLKAKSLHRAVNLIRNMKTRAFGQVLMSYYIFLMVLNKNKKLTPERQMQALKRAALAINQSRPTFPFSFFTTMVLGWAKSAEAKKNNISLYVAKNIRGFLKSLKAKRINQAQDLSRLIKSGDSILTHCNVSGSLVLAAEFCRKQKKKLKFFATETRPYFQGSRLTAWELKRSGFDVTILPDNAVASLMSKRLVNKVVLGADHAAQNGDIANKIGTYQIALLARHFGIPFYVLAPPPSGAKNGKDIKVEFRPDRELLEFRGRRIAPYGAKCLYPAFDITPNQLITKRIGLEL